ncbi:MAG: hypothetical protein M3O70_20015, partial [Actinomycetota bacterium]|nr:hypothetical protein [Actinomycetota bacterium]
LGWEGPEARAGGEIWDGQQDGPGGRPGERSSSSERSWPARDRDRIAQDRDRLDQREGPQARAGGELEDRHGGGWDPSGSWAVRGGGGRSDPS